MGMLYKKYLIFLIICLLGVTKGLAQNTKSYEPSRRDVISNALDEYEYGRNTTNDDNTIPRTRPQVVEPRKFRYQPPPNNAQTNNKSSWSSNRQFHDEYSDFDDMEMKFNVELFEQEISRLRGKSYDKKSFSEKDDSWSQRWIDEELEEEQKSIFDQEGSFYEFMNSLDYGYSNINGDEHHFFVEGMQKIPALSSPNSAVFLHERAGYDSQREWTTSIGTGYRQGILNDKAIVGVNTFFDYQQKNKHYRNSYGLELFTDNMEARANYYNALSGRRTDKETDEIVNYEKAADGFDVEVGGDFLSVDWLKLYGGYTYFDYIHGEDSKGWKARAEVNPSEHVSLNFETYGSGLVDRDYRVEGRFTLDFAELGLTEVWDAVKELRGDLPEETRAELLDRLMDRVEREFVIEVEKWSESKITPLPVGSGGDIQIQLIWDTDSDMDLHINLPAGVPAHVYFAQLQSFLGASLFASLDVDDIPLSGFHSNHPSRDHVENIFVTENLAVAGVYNAYVHAFNLVTNPTRVEVNVFKGGNFLFSSTHNFTSTGEIFNLPAISWP